MGDRSDEAGCGGFPAGVGDAFARIHAAGEPPATFAKTCLAPWRAAAPLRRAS